MNTTLRVLAGDEAIEALFSDETQARFMMAFEAALAEAEAEAGLIPERAARAIITAAATAKVELPSLAAAIGRDGVVGPAFVAAFRQQLPDEPAHWLHHGATSQDLVDTALILALKEAISLLDARLSTLLNALARLRAEVAALPLMAHTRMQRALPFTAGDKIDSWMQPLARLRQRLQPLAGDLLQVQLGGPVGTRGTLDGKGNAVAARMAERLGLGAGPSWHTSRECLIAFADWLSLVCGALGKIGADVGLMAQNEVGAVRIAGGGGSSAMPHKSNPVVAEVLVALARFNAGLVATMHQAQIHENERSGAAWTLEWLTLPQMVIVSGASLNWGNRLIESLTFVADPSVKDRP